MHWIPNADKKMDKNELDVIQKICEKCNFWCICISCARLMFQKARNKKRTNDRSKERQTDRNRMNEEKETHGQCVSFMICYIMVIIIIIIFKFMLSESIFFSFCFYYRFFSFIPFWSLCIISYDVYRHAWIEECVSTQVSVNLDTLFTEHDGIWSAACVLFGALSRGMCVCLIWWLCVNGKSLTISSCLYTIIRIDIDDRLTTTLLDSQFSYFSCKSSHTMWVCASVLHSIWLRPKWTNQWTEWNKNKLKHNAVIYDIYQIDTFKCAINLNALYIRIYKCTSGFSHLHLFAWVI